MDRRLFIKTTLAGATFALTAATLFPACRRNHRLEQSLPNMMETENRILGKTGTTILYYASLAPSGHNTQPWTVKVLTENHWIIGTDPKRRLPTVDPHNREVMLSMGAFLENLSIAAGVLGYEADIRVETDDPFSEKIATVRLKASSPTNYPLEKISARRTVKSGHLQKELSLDDIRLLSEPLNGRSAYFPRGSEHAACIQEGTMECFRLQSMRDEAQKELAEWIRFSDREALERRDGLTPDTMEIQGIAGWYVRNFMDRSDVMKPGFRKQGIQKTADQAREGGGWIIITSPGRSVADLVESGRLFQRMALRARERMIAVHPMTQLLEEESGQELFRSNHGKDIIPQLVLRVGYLKRYPDPVSLRRPVSWFVK